MAKASDATPTPEQVNEAQEILRRDQEARAAAERERIQPLIDLINSDEFQVVKNKLDDLPTELLGDPRFFAHVNAFRTGFSGLANVAPPVVAMPTT